MWRSDVPIISNSSTAALSCGSSPSSSLLLLPTAWPACFDGLCWISAVPFDDDRIILSLLFFWIDVIDVLRYFFPCLLSMKSNLTAPMATAMMMHNDKIRAFVEERFLLPDSGLNGFFTNMVLKLCERLHEEGLFSLCRGERSSAGVSFEWIHH